MMGISHLKTELMRFDRHFLGAVVPINLNAVQAANDATNLLINRMEASLESYGQSLRGQISQGLVNAVIQGDVTNAAVKSKIGGFFLQEEWKLTRIVRTELHGVYNLGKLTGMENLQEGTLPDLQKTLMHPMDGRTGEDSKHVAKLDLIVDIDEPFSYTWAGKRRTYMVPPDRPNDRSILVPFRASWGKGRADFVPG